MSGVATRLAVGYVRERGGSRPWPRCWRAPVVSQRVGGASRVVVRALGSVEAVYRHARGVAAKFSTMKTVEPSEIGHQPALTGSRPSRCGWPWTTSAPATRC